MDSATPFIISYVIQLALGGYALLKMPMHTRFDEHMRRVVLTFAILPCMFLGVIFQLVAIGWYHFRKATEAKTISHMDTSFDTDDQSLKPPPNARPSNPFESIPDTGSTFAEHEDSGGPDDKRDDPDEAPRENPFL